MRRVLVLLPSAMLIAAAPPVDKADIGKGCINHHGADLAATQPGSNGFHRLDQLPPANEILTVIHSVDGCQKPVIVRYNIGGNPSLTK